MLPPPSRTTPPSRTSSGTFLTQWRSSSNRATGSHACVLFYGTFHFCIFELELKLKQRHSLEPRTSCTRGHVVNQYATHGSVVCWMFCLITESVTIKRNSKPHTNDKQIDWLSRCSHVPSGNCLKNDFLYSHGSLTNVLFRSQKKACR